MKKIILLLLFFAARNITSQNGFATFSASVPSGTTASQETTIFIDNAGNKWVGFSGGGPSISLVLAKYDNATSAWTYWSKAAMGIVSPTLGLNVKALTQDNSGNIWIGTNNGLIKYDGISFTLFNTGNGLPHNLINCLEFHNNMLYVGTLGGLSRYDGVNFTNYNLANTLLPISNIVDIEAEATNVLWMTSGVNLVKFALNSTFTSTSYTNAVTSSTANLLYGIYIDPSGNKWLRMYDGIAKYDNVAFTYFDALYPNFWGTNLSFSRSIIKGPNNGVLILGNSGGTNCLIEFLPWGNYNTYLPPSTVKLGTTCVNDATGKTFITGAVTTTPSLVANMHSFNYSNYSVYGSFGLGSGVTQYNFKFLDINRVRAAIANRGDMWWDMSGSGNAMYEVPKNTPAFSGPSSGFAAALWIGGLDASNQLHTAAQTYRQAGGDFWPGPLDTTNAFIDTIAVVNYDKIWKVSMDDINTFLYQFSLGNVPSLYVPTPDILNWPAKGTGAKSRNLAPFVDVNNNGIYDPLVGGDYPKIKGDQTLYYIFNDNFGPHTETGGLPFGIEVHAMAYAYGCPSVLNGRTELAYTTFYDYKVFNRSNNNYHDVSVGFWTDVDLGCYLDDYIGSSVHDNLGFCYNSTANDGSCSGAIGYDLYPPAVGTTVLKGPLANTLDGIDNDNDSIVDEIGEQCLMNVFDYYSNNTVTIPVQTTNPKTKYHYYNYLTGKWKDSTNFTCGGNAYGGTTPTKFVYPWSNYNGNLCGTWTEATATTIPGDRRYIVSTGLFNLPAKGNVEVEYAQVWSVDSFATSNVNLASVNKLINDTKKIRSFYNSGGKSCVAINIGIEEKELNNSSFIIYPNPANSVLNIKSEEAMGKSLIIVTDILGKTVLESKGADLYQTSINIEQLNSGIYFLNIKFDSNKSIVKKFVKQ